MRKFFTITLALLSTVLASTAIAADYELYKENQGIIKQIEDRDDEKNLSFLDGQWEVVEYSGKSTLPREYKKYNGKFYILKATTAKKTVDGLRPLRQDIKYRSDYLRSVASLRDAREIFSSIHQEKLCYPVYAKYPLDLNISKSEAFKMIEDEYYECFEKGDSIKENAPYLSFFLYDKDNGIVANLPLNYFNHKKHDMSKVNPLFWDYLKSSKLKEDSFKAFKNKYDIDPEDLVDFITLSARYSVIGIDIIDNDNFIAYELNVDDGPDDYMVLRRIPENQHYETKYRADLLDEYFESIKDEL